MTPEQDPANTAQKPGWKSTEFWLTAATFIVGALLSSGVFPDESGAGKIIGMVASLLGVLGYQVQRGMVKASGNKAAAIVAATTASTPPNPS